MAEGRCTISRTRMLLCIILSIIPASFLIYRFHAIVPFWDGAIYARCIIELGHHSPLFPFPRCGVGDPAVSYFMPLWLSYIITGAGIPGLYIGGLSLLLLYLYSVSVILRRSILQNPSRIIDCLLPIVIFACDPLIITYLLVISPDFGTTVFTTAYMAAILSGHLVLALALGILTLFSKATAVSLFGLVGSASLGFISMNRGASLTTQVRFLMSRFVFVIVIPLLVYWSSIYVFKIFPTSFGTANLKSVCWSRPDNIFDLLFTFDFSSTVATNYLFNIFFLNFHWLEVLLLLVCLGVGLYRRLAGTLSPRFDWSGSKSYFTLGIIFLLMATYTTTRCQHVNNPKYILVTVPFFHLAFLFSTYFAGLRIGTRNLVLAAIIPLQLVSSVATIDPVSKWFYGVFPFGNAALLSMNSRTGECCGLGRDQLFYNTQALYIDEITERIIKEIPATSDFPLVVDNLAGFNLLARETSKRERCLSPYQGDCNEGTHVLGSRPFAPTRMPQSFMYIDYPFTPIPVQRRDFAQLYDLESTMRFTSGDYFIDTYRYTRRGRDSAQ